MTDKVSIQEGFHGGAVEMRNNFDFPERDRKTGEKTGAMVKAQAGVFLHTSDGKTMDITHLDLPSLLKAYEKLCKKPLAKQLLEEIAATR